MILTTVISYNECKCSNVLWMNIPFYLRAFGAKYASAPTDFQRDRLNVSLLVIHMEET